MTAYSMDLRRRVLASCDRGESTKVVAERFGVCPSWVRRLKQRRREQGQIGPRDSGGDRRGKFRGAALERLRERVAAQPDLTLDQLREWVAEAFRAAARRCCCCSRTVWVAIGRHVHRSPRFPGRIRRKDKHDASIRAIASRRAMSFRGAARSLADDDDDQCHSLDRCHS